MNIAEAVRLVVDNFTSLKLAALLEQKVGAKEVGDYAILHAARHPLGDPDHDDWVIIAFKKDQVGKDDTIPFPILSCENTFHINVDTHEITGPHQSFTSARNAGMWVIKIN